MGKRLLPIAIFRLRLTKAGALRNYPAACPFLAALGVGSWGAYAAWKCTGAARFLTRNMCSVPEAAKASETKAVPRRVHAQSVVFSNC